MGGTEGLNGMQSFWLPLTWTTVWPFKDKVFKMVISGTDGLQESSIYCDSIFLCPAIAFLVEQP